MREGVYSVLALEKSDQQEKQEDHPDRTWCNSGRQSHHISVNNLEAMNLQKPFDQENPMGPGYTH